MAGASSFQDPEAHNIFLHARSAIVCIFIYTVLNNHWLTLCRFIFKIYTAVLEERATFLAEQSWLKEPWNHRFKSSTSIILDVIAQIPTILGLTRAIQSAVDSGEQYEHLLDDFDALSVRIGKMLDERSAIIMDPSSKDASCDSVQEFAAVQLYHCCELFCYDAMQRIARHALLFPTPFAKYVQEVTRLKPQMEACASEIVSNIYKFYTDDCGFITANRLFLPILGANRFLQHNNSDDKEIVAACRHIIRAFIKRGFHFLQNYV